MTFLAIIGALVITGVLCWLTMYPVGFAMWGLMGGDTSGTGAVLHWLIVALMFTVVGILWILWWSFIGTHITIGFR